MDCKGLAVQGGLSQRKVDHKLTWLTLRQKGAARRLRLFGRGAALPRRYAWHQRLASDNARMLSFVARTIIAFLPKGLKPHTPSNQSGGCCSQSRRKFHAEQVAGAPGSLHQPL
jgi:hypothetical protein